MLRQETNLFLQTVSVGHIKFAFARPRRVKNYGKRVENSLTLFVNTNCNTFFFYFSTVTEECITFCKEWDSSAGRVNRLQAGRLRISGSDSRKGQDTFLNNVEIDSGDQTPGSSSKGKVVGM
jgi:hypothetical protein